MTIACWEKIGIDIDVNSKHCFKRLKLPSAVVKPEEVLEEYVKRALPVLARDYHKNCFQ